MRHQKAHPLAETRRMTYRTSKSVHLCVLGVSRSIKQKRYTFVYVFVHTTHVVAATHGFACMGKPTIRLYIRSLIEIRSGVSEPHGVKIWLFPLLWLVAFTTACTTVLLITKTDHQFNT